MTRLPQRSPPSPLGRALSAFLPATPVPLAASTPRRPRCSLSRAVCCQPSPAQDATVISWNVNSLRSLLRKNPLALRDLDRQYTPQVLCLQETKLQQQHEKLFTEALDELHTALFSSSTARLGYSGTAVLSRPEAAASLTEIHHEAGDLEGRLIMAEYPGLFLVNVYTVNSGAHLRRLPVRLSWDSAFRRFIRHLRTYGKPVMVLGDLNVARTPHDVFDVAAAQGVPGFTDEERLSFEDTLETCGLVDAFRMFHPDEHRSFTYWDYKSRARDRNDGWRIDYALVTDDMVGAVRDVRILDDVLGSDHCPVAVDLAPGLLS